MKKKKYFQDIERNPLLNKMVREIYDRLGTKNKDHVLDVGCGGAYFGMYLPDHLSQVQLSGVDIDEVAKIGLKHNYSNIYIQDLDIQPHLKQFKNNSVDFIIAKDFLEHIQKPWLVVTEFYRILKPGGKVYAHVPNYTSSMAWIDYSHVRPYCKRSLKLLFEDFGFRTLQINYDMFWFFTDKFFARTLVNLPILWRLAGGIEIIAQKPLK